MSDTNYYFEVYAIGNSSNGDLIGPSTFLTAKTAKGEAGGEDM